MLRSIADLTKTTLIGGLLVVLPIYIAFILLAKAIKSALGLVAPITNQLPAGVEFRLLAAIGIVIGVCFLAGILVRTDFGRKAKNAIERNLLERVPGYSMLRDLTARMTGHEQDETWAPALAEIEDALVPAFVIEELEDGAYTVFVPSIPTPAAGAIYILPRERVHVIDVPFAQALRVITKWGVGAGELRARIAR
jgi:uncharacterized membrane protein